MIIGLPEGEFEILSNDGEFVLLRAKHQPDQGSTLMVRPAAAHPTKTNLLRLEQAYALRGELDASWAARPIELIDENGKLALLVEDPGGDLLSTLLGKPWDVRTFLRVSAGLARAVSGLHRRGLIHKDLKPSNVFVDLATGQAWLAGFGLTARLAHERNTSGPPQTITGTLAYIAPEQTGRMNRSVDTRSDLYSLGVTLYQMMTGTLPFKASEPMEWIHCHIARQPAAPGEGRQGIPRVLSAIVLKLLAKNPEDRYQTARGVEADFQQCLSEWESTAQVEQFQLAVHDLPDRLLIPERLYGRECEIAALVEAFERMARDGRQALVLVSGSSGVGKSSIVNELQQVVVRRRGFFASGKFEPHERDTPFAPVVRAFRDLVRSVLLSSAADLQRWREDILRALGANAQLLVDLVPEIELIIGPQAPVADLPPQQAQARLYRTLQKFVGIFARSEHPLVLFLDDLQWLDRASLDLLADLATHDERMHLLLVGSYRHNEVGPTHPLSTTLSAIRGTSIVNELEMAALHPEDVRVLISDTLHQGEDHIGPLAEVVYEKTAGNPFFVKQFLHELADEGCLTFDTSAGAWAWDLARIQAKRYTDNVFDLLAGKLDRLSVTTQEALRILACFERGRTDALVIVQECSEDDLHAKFSEAVEVGLVSRGEDGYSFCHDRIREAAYQLVPEHERAAVHLRIGRLLQAKLPTSDTSEKIFEVVNQLDRGVALVTSIAERLQIAELNLVAGRRARATSAYKSALLYLAAGEALVSEDHWEEHYSLRFALAFHRAECEFLTGELLTADQRLLRLRERAVGEADLSAVARLRMPLYTTLDRTDRAVGVGLEQLIVLGIEWSHPGPEEVREEYRCLRQRLGERTIEALVALPSTSDPGFLALMGVLLDMLPAAVFTDKNLHDLAVLRMTNLSLEHGLCDASILACAELSHALGPRFGDDLDGFRFGNLGLKLAERAEFAPCRHKVYTVVAYHVLPWTASIQAAISLMRRAFELAEETGDLVFAAFSAVHITSLRLATGDRLEEVEREAEAYLAYSRRAGFGLLVYCFLGQLQFVRALRKGRTTDSKQHNSASSEEATVEQRLEQNPRLAIAACFYWIRKLQSCFHEGDYASALQMAAKAEPLLWTSPTFFENAEYHFYSALAHAQVWNSAPESELPGHHQALSRHQAQLATWSAHCAETFASRAALAAAELARLENRILDAERLYEEAIRSANVAGHVNVEAIADELAGQFYRTRGFGRIAEAYFASASSCYRRWGAEAVAQRLDAYSGFGAGRLDLRPTDSTTASVEGLELATVVEASQTISGEILIDKLVETLMVTVLEHAGAQRGLLIVQRGEEARVEAEATTQLDAIKVHFSRMAVGPSDLPQTVLNYVLRTHETVILDDASVQNPFSADDYLVAQRIRALMCLPLVKQAMLVGVLYLENNVASHVFTPARTALLKLLASQAAISLDNARLYADLREAQAYLAEAQLLSATGSFGWKPVSGEIVWSEETYRIYALDGAMKPTVEFALSRAHPEDRDRVQQLVDRATHETRDWDLEHRIVMADGTVKHLHVVAHAVHNELTGETEYVGAVMDITERKRAEEELQHLVDFVPQLIVVMGPEGEWMHVNRIAREYTGLTLDEYRSVDVISRVIHPDDAEKMRTMRERGLSAADPFEIDARLLGKDGVYRWFLFQYNPWVEEGSVRRWYATATEIESRKQKEERVRKENLLLEERTRIAQELHDTLLQSFQSASLQLGATLLGVAPDSPVKPQLDRILQIMTQGIEEGRNAIEGLRSSDLQTSDLVRALSGIREEIEVQPDIDFRVNVVGRQQPLRPPIRQEVYRIGREALLNAFSHSRAKCVEFELEYADNGLSMRIRDNGCGIDSEVLQSGRKGHWGLPGMRERASRIGGLLKISSDTTVGTEVQLFISSDISFQLSPVD